jgi:hypothetical protein
MSDNKNHRFISHKEVMFITGRSKGGATGLMMKIRKANGKQKEQPITLKEFCIYCNYDIDETYDTLERK